MSVVVQGLRMLRREVADMADREEQWREPRRDSRILGECGFAVLTGKLLLALQLSLLYTNYRRANTQ